MAHIKQLLFHGDFFPRFVLFASLAIDFDGEVNCYVLKSKQSNRISLTFSVFPLYFSLVFSPIILTMWKMRSAYSSTQIDWIYTFGCINKAWIGNDNETQPSEQRKYSIENFPSQFFFSSQTQFERDFYLRTKAVRCKLYSYYTSSNIVIGSIR